ncbi:MAG: TIGR01459 family HAD-type hydrolase [Caulobacteraceae bacterium]
MVAPSPIAGLSELTPAYDALLCDIWGVVHNGVTAFEDACATLIRFRAEHGPVVLISNSPRPRAGVISQLRALKVHAEAWDAVVTSGDVTRIEIGARAPGPAWAVGPARDAPLYEGLGIDFVETPEEAAFVACTGPFDDEVETPEDFRTRFEVCVARGLHMVCANPDRVVQRGDKLIYCGGALADLYEALGGKVTMAGKPYAPIYDAAVAEIATLLKRPVDRARILAIGDGAPTDVAGANAQGLDCLFIAGGIHAEQAFDAKSLAGVLAHEGVHARYAMAGLRW